MCQNSDYKIISFLEPGAPHCFGNAAAGYDSCWSASELCQMGSDLALQEMSEKKRRVHKNGWQVEAGGEKKVCCGEKTVWHVGRIQYHVLVML